MQATPLSRTVDLDGGTHYLEFAGPGDTAPLVCLHGLGGSHVHWSAVGPGLAEHHRVYALDLAGHGLTLPDHRGTDVDSNQRLLDRFLRTVVGSPAVLVGNSMGGMVSVLQAARNPETVRALVLVAAAVPGPRHRVDPQVARNFMGYSVPVLAEPMLARRRRRLGPAGQVRDTLELCCADPDRVPSHVVDEAVRLATHRQHVPGVDAAFIDAARSVMRHQARRVHLQAAMRSIDVPVLLLHGDKDRLVPVATSRQAARRHLGWELRVAPGVGHFPQLEAPEWTLAAYRDWGAGVDLVGSL